MDNNTQNQTSSVSNFPVEYDFFKELYSNTELKQITIVTFFIGAIFGLILEFGIIWYERFGNHRHRTVINQLFSTISWLVVLYIILVYIPDGIRYLIGPLPTNFCDVHLFMKNFLCTCVVLTLDFIILLRYIFIFKLCNFAVINDDLVATFLQMTILLLSLWVTGVKRMSVGRMPLNYFMCAGKNPNEENAEAGPGGTLKKVDTTGILVTISVALNIFLLAKIFLYQRKVEKRTQDIQLGRINPFGNNAQQQNLAWSNTDNERKKISSLPKSMSDLTTQILCFIFHVIFVIVCIAMNRIEPINLNERKNRWLAYYIQIIGIAIAILGTCTAYYVRNRSLPKAIWRNVKEHFQR